MAIKIRKIRIHLINGRTIVKEKKSNFVNVFDTVDEVEKFRRQLIRQYTAQEKRKGNKYDTIEVLFNIVTKDRFYADLPKVA